MKLELLKQLYNNSRALTKADAFRNQAIYKELKDAIETTDKELADARQEVELARARIKELEARVNELDSYVIEYNKTVHVNGSYKAVYVVKFNTKHRAYNNGVIMFEYDGTPVKGEAKQAV